MKTIKNLLTAWPLIYFVNNSIAQMGISATAGFVPNNSAILDLSSTTKGFLPPRMTTSQRNAISSPTVGLVIFDTDLNSPFYFNGSSWVNHSGIGSFVLPYSATQFYAGDLFVLNNSYNLAGSTAFKAINNGGGPAVTGTNTGAGNGGSFSNGSFSTVAGLISATFGSGPAIEGRAGNTGTAGKFEIGVPTNFNTALVALTYGQGRAFTASTLGTSNATEARNNSTTEATSVILNQSTNGPALELQGGIKVTGTANQKTAFKIVSNAGNININQLRIPNTTVANNIDDILIITHNYGTGATNNFTKACGVYWDPGFLEWRIYVEDSSAMPVGITFNVLVIKQ